MTYHPVSHRFEFSRCQTPSTASKESASLITTTVRRSAEPECLLGQFLRGSEY